MRLLAALLACALAATMTVAQPAPHPNYKLPEGAAFTQQDVVIARTGALARDQRKYEQAPSFNIAGTLNLPDPAKFGAGPWPCVLFVSGSGSQDRHGYQGNLDLGTWQFLDAIANAGFVVLRTDDRGIGATPVGYSGMVPAELGYRDLVDDARACLRWLKERPEVDKSRVFVVGHSEGGLTAPLLACEAELGLRGIAVLAGPGRNLVDVMNEQVEASMKGQSKAIIEANMKVQREIMQAIKEGREPDFNVVPRAVWKRTESQRAWIQDHANTDVAATLKKIRCPVLVLQGAADFQVSAERDARPLAAQLAQGTCPDVTLRIYDDLDHLFKPCGGKPSTMQMYFQKRAVAEAPVSDLVAWLKRQG